VPISRQIEPIVATDDELRSQLEDAHLPSLLVALAHATGDESLLEDALRPDAAFLAGPQGGYDEAKIARAKGLCLAALQRLRDEPRSLSQAPDEATLRRWLTFLVGDIDLDAYLPLLLDELALDGDVRAPQWHKAELAPERDFSVAIVGAGMSGLAAALRLQQAGIPFVVLEKNDDVGGTWYENSYPGCRVDVPNHSYSYSFAQDADWPQLFSTRDALLDYFQRVAKEFDLRRHVRFGTEVKEAVFDEVTCTWTLVTLGPRGTEKITVQAIISAVGQLNRPRMPDIADKDEFRGPSFHSAEWRHDVSLEGKKVVVIGTGASACQFIPIVANQAEALTVFQRTPPWLLPTPEYHDKVPEGLHWLYRHVPFYAQWYRFWLFWVGSEGLLPTVNVDPEWKHPERSVSGANDFVREMLTEYLREQCGDDTELFEKMLPSYPPFSKRFVRDTGIWPETFKREHVTLETRGIDRITETGVRTSDGRDVEADVIIFGTGFRASQFLVPMKVTGRGGRDLHEVWQGDARAYLGIVVPHFPNLFMCYGPNTNIVVNGSIIYFSECEIDYVLASIRMLLEGQHGAMDCRTDAHDDYNLRIDEANNQRAWGAATVNTWYRNAKGRISQNWPFSLLDYWKQTRTPDPSDFDLL